MCTLALHEHLVHAVKLETIEERQSQVCSGSPLTCPSLASHLPLTCPSLASYLPLTCLSFASQVCSLLSHLPLAHLNTLAHLMRHLHLLSLSSSLTNMTPRNLAIVWAPNLLRSGALVDEIRDIGAGSQLVELLVSSTAL